LGGQIQDLNLVSHPDFGDHQKSDLNWILINFLQADGSK